MEAESSVFRDSESVRQQETTDNQNEQPENDKSKTTSESVAKPEEESLCGCELSEDNKTSDIEEIISHEKKELKILLNRARQMRKSDSESLLQWNLSEHEMKKKSKTKARTVGAARMFQQSIRRPVNEKFTLQKSTSSKPFHEVIQKKKVKRLAQGSKVLVKSQVDDGSRMNVIKKKSKGRKEPIKKATKKLEMEVPKEPSRVKLKINSVAKKIRRGSKDVKTSVSKTIAKIKFGISIIGIQKAAALITQKLQDIKKEKHKDEELCEVASNLQKSNNKLDEDSCGCEKEVPSKQNQSELKMKKGKTPLK